MLGFVVVLVRLGYLVVPQNIVKVVCVFQIQKKTYGREEYTVFGKEIGNSSKVLIAISSATIIQPLRA